MSLMSPRKRGTTALVVVVALLATLVAPQAATATRPENFVDVPRGSFFDEPAKWLQATGITTGTSPTTFSPDNGLTRGQMATFLWRYAGKPSSDKACGFTDVKATAFYAEAVCWAKASGIANGTSRTTFSPGRFITRAEMSVILWRFADEPTAPNHRFIDEGSIPSWAREATDWLYVAKVTTNDPYGPSNVVSRAQMAAFLWRANGVLDLKPFAPTTPTDVTAIAAVDRVVVSWVSPEARHVADNHVITIERPNGEDVAGALGETSPERDPSLEGYSFYTGSGETTFEVVGVKPGFDLRFSVEALNGGGWSELSDWSDYVLVEQPETNTPAQNVVVEATPDFVSFDGDGESSFAAPAGVDMQVGQIFVSSVGIQPFYGKVTYVGAGLVQTKSVDLPEVLPEVQFRAEMDPRFGEASSTSPGVQFIGTTTIYQEDLAAGVAPAGADGLFASDEYNQFQDPEPFGSQNGFAVGENPPKEERPSFDIEGAKECLDGEVFDLTVRVELTRFTADVDWEGLTLKKAEFLWNPIVRPMFQTNPDGVIDCEFTYPLAKVPLIATVFAIGPVPVVFDLTLDVEAFLRVAVNIDAGTEQEAWVTGSFGARYENGKLQPVVDLKGGMGEFKAWGPTDQLNLLLQAGARTRLSARFYKAFGLSTTFSMYIQTTMDPLTAPGEVEVSAWHVVNLEVFFSPFDLIDKRLELAQVRTLLLGPFTFDIGAFLPFGDAPDPGESRSTFLGLGNASNVGFSALDENGRFVYYASSGADSRRVKIPSSIVKVEINPFRQVARTNLPAGMQGIASMVQSRDKQYLYILTWGDVGKNRSQYLVKFRTSDMSIASSVLIPNVPDYLFYGTASVDPVGQNVYLAAGRNDRIANDAGRVMKVSASNMEIQSVIELSDFGVEIPFGGPFYTSQIPADRIGPDQTETGGRYLYLISYSIPTQVIQFDIVEGVVSKQYSFPPGIKYRFADISAASDDGKWLYIGMRTGTVGANSMIARLSLPDLSLAVDLKTWDEDSIALGGGNVSVRGILPKPVGAYVLGGTSQIDIIGVTPSSQIPQRIVKKASFSLPEVDWRFTPSLTGFIESPQYPTDYLFGFEGAESEGMAVKVNLRGIVTAEDAFGLP